MFKKVLKKIFYSKAQKEQEQKQGEHFPEPLWRKQAKQMPLKKNLQANLDTIHQILGDSQDIIIRKMAVRSTNIALVYLEGMVDYAVINDFILKPIVLESRQAKPDKDFPPKELYHRLLYNVTPAGEVVEAGDFDQLIFLVLTGIGAVLVDGIDKAIMVSAKGWPKRAVNEPDIESVIRGPREGFTETLRVNTVLIRRRIRDPNLRIITTQIGGGVRLMSL